MTKNLTKEEMALFNEWTEQDYIRRVARCDTPWRRFGQKIGIFNKPNLREFKDIMLLHPDLPFLIHRKKIGWDDGSYRERFYADREIANA